MEKKEADIKRFDLTRIEEQYKFHCYRFIRKYCFHLFHLYLSELRCLYFNKLIRSHLLARWFRCGLNIIVTDSALGVLNVFAQKLVIIPMTLATGFSMALLPSVTKAYVSGDR